MEKRIFELANRGAERPQIQSVRITFMQYASFFNLHKPYGSVSGATCAASLCSLGAQQAVVIEHHELQQSERERDGPQQA